MKRGSRADVGVIQGGRKSFRSKREDSTRRNLVNVDVYLCICIMPCLEKCIEFKEYYVL